LPQRPDVISLKPVHIRLLSWAASLAVGGIASVLLLGVGTYYYLAPGLPDVEALRDTRLQLPLRVYSRDGQLLAQIGDQRRVPVKFAEIPPHVVQAFIDAEDDRFFEHGGIDVMGLTRSLLLAVLHGELSQGGSTITQQLARNVFPIGREKELKRKLREIFLSFRLESEFSKQEILTLYLNKIYLGEKAYGVAAAAETYFGKGLDDLTIAEAATLGGLPQRPARVNPVANPEAMRHRRAYVLRRMYAKNHITEEEYTAALEAPMQSRSHSAGCDTAAALTTAPSGAAAARQSAKPAPLPRSTRQAVPPGSAGSALPQCVYHTRCPAAARPSTCHPASAQESEAACTRWRRAAHQKLAQVARAARDQHVHGGCSANARSGRDGASALASKGAALLAQ
jgi:membrane peptidoglycan carboxypeptidase